MHFHLPKPLHGWREFTGEVGIVVIGVLIALGAEQVVEDFRNAAQLRQAEQRMTAEIRDDDLPQAFARAAIGTCNDSQLNDIERAVEKRDRDEIARFSSSYNPPFRTWDDDAWKAALASQALKYGDGDRAIAWSGMYVGMPIANQWTSDEQDGLRQLRAKIGGSGPLSTVQQDRLFELIADLRGTNKRMTGGAKAFLRFAAALDISVTPTDRAAILAEAHRDYGSCVTDPAQTPRSAGPPRQYEVSRQARANPGTRS
jgi:hypothetical protein